MGAAGGAGGVGGGPSPIRAQHTVQTGVRVVPSNETTAKTVRVFREAPLSPAMDSREGESVRRSTGARITPAQAWRIFRWLLVCVPNFFRYLLDKIQSRPEVHSLRENLVLAQGVREDHPTRIGYAEALGKAAQLDGTKTHDFMNLLREEAEKSKGALEGLSSTIENFGAELEEAAKKENLSFDPTATLLERHEALEGVYKQKMGAAKEEAKQKITELENKIRAEKGKWWFQKVIRDYKNPEEAKEIAALPQRLAEAKRHSTNIQTGIAFPELIQWEKAVKQRETLEETCQTLVRSWVVNEVQARVLPNTLVPGEMRSPAQILAAGVDDLLGVCEEELAELSPEILAFLPEGFLEETIRGAIPVAE